MPFLDNVSLFMQAFVLSLNSSNSIIPELPIICYQPLVATYHLPPYFSQAIVLTVFHRPLMLVLQRLPSLRTDLQYPGHLVQKRLVLDCSPALQKLDIICLRVDFLSQLCLRHLESFCRPPLLDGFCDLRINLLWGDDIVGAIDFC